MKIRFIIILSLLVVAPTAILSLIASKTLKNREHELHASLVSSAEQSIALINQQVLTRLEANLDTIRVALSDALSQGSRLEYGKPGIPETDLIIAETLRLKQSVSTAAEIYLFMNPWGFLVPQDNLKLPVPTSELGELITVLRNEIASAKSLTGMIVFSHSGKIYCFSLLRDRKGLYAGFRIDGQGLTALIQEVSSSAAAKGFTIKTTGIKDSRSDLVITDSFNSSESNVRTQLPADNDWKTEDILASGHLDKPLDYIELNARLDDPEEFHRAEVIRTRLLSWGIALLAIAVIAGMGFVMVESGTEIRRARERSDFMMGVSHDLRTPISSIKILSESMLMGNIPDENKKKKFLETISSECNHLADMIEGVLFFMKQEHGSSIYTLTPTDIEELVRSSVKSFEERAHDRANAHVSIAKNLPRVNADKNALAKVLQNLLDNAMKYSSNQNTSAHPDKGEGSAQIELGVKTIKKRDREWVLISVRDYGIGIEKSELNKVFRKFYRASLEMDGKVGGIGLGLALCRDIIRAHKGKIEVTSQRGKGSEFKIYLPVSGGEWEKG